MESLLVCIGRRENRYIREYVEYYRDLGFDRIVICDNNYDGEESFVDVLSGHIENGFVVIEDYRNKSCCQVSCYNEMYRKYRGLYDWIAFFDCDEFLTFKDPETKLPDYLSRDVFSGYDAILINWMMYDDNDQLYDDGRPVLERLSRPCDYNFKGSYNFPENNHVKSILHSSQYKADNPFGGGGVMHCPSTDNNCDNAGKPIGMVTPYIDYNYDVAWIRHFSYKTVTEFANGKLNYGTPDKIQSEHNRKSLIKLFFRVNRKTDEKLKILNDLGYNA